jgi:uncharacterized protein YggE
MRSGLVVFAMLVALVVGAIVVIWLVRVPNIYSVEGNGEVKYVPDEASIAVGYYAEAPVSADAVAQAAKTMRAVLAALRAAGVQEGAITSTAVRSDMVADEARSSTPAVQRKPLFFAYQSVSVDVKNLDEIGRLVGEISKAGANYWSVRYKVSEKKQRELLEAAHHEALANAVARADAHARAGNFKRGRILKLQDGATSFPTVDYGERGYDLGERRRSYGSGYAYGLVGPVEKVTVTGTRIVEKDTTFDVPPPKEVTVSADVDVLFEMD